MSIASELSRLHEAKVKIKTAIAGKGVTVPSGAKLDSYNGYINQIKSGSAYSPPSDWIDISDCAAGNIQLLVNDCGFATYAFVCTTIDETDYQINWGDGTTLTYSSGATAQHTYTVGSGQPCSRGYTTFKVIISPVNGGCNSFGIQFHDLSNRPQYPGVLSCVINSNTLTSLSNAFYHTSTVNATCIYLESCKVINTDAAITAGHMFHGCSSLRSIDISGLTNLEDASYMFYGCYALRSVDVSPLTKVTNASNMFYNCYALEPIMDVSAMVSVKNASQMFRNCSSLQDINTSGMNAVTDTSYMFCNCYSLLSVDISGFTESTNASFMFSNCILQSVDASVMTKVTNTSYMFNGCNCLKSVNISGMTLVRDAANMFSSCYMLKDLTNTNFASSAASTNFTKAFSYCEQLKNIDFPEAKMTSITAVGTSGLLNKLEMLTFSPASPFSSTTAPQVDIQYNALTAEQLNAIFTALPTVNGKTIRITGCTGASSCDKTIATAKGWTVTG